ncbi:unnamed protein product, partial [Urochloa humidicola]
PLPPASPPRLLRRRCWVPSVAAPLPPGSCRPPPPGPREAAFSTRSASDALRQVHDRRPPPSRMRWLPVGPSKPPPAAEELLIEYERNGSGNDQECMCNEGKKSLLLSPNEYGSVLWEVR